ncbi:MAG: hypothetical protein M0015_14340 [Betaproteobacteria bacterium]|nr:hypothetical protein [Betaproteobacteria bacterium]
MWRVAILVLLLAGCAAPPPRAPGTLEFALLGDTPYSQAQANLLDAMIDDMNAAPLAFAVHVGDITSGQGPCSNAWLEARKRELERSTHALVLLPGDNEWTDCWREGFDPLERLAFWRGLFCTGDHSLGAHPIALERQSSDPRFPEYCENVRWSAANVEFVGVNVPGSNNDLGRTPRMDAEYEHRMRAVLAWLKESFDRAAREHRAAVMVLMHADPHFEPEARPKPDGYATLREALTTHAREFPGRVLLVHGDSHAYRDDTLAPNLRRIEVFGAPAVRWLRASVLNGEIRVVPAD